MPHEKLQPLDDLLNNSAVDLSVLKKTTHAELKESGDAAALAAVAKLDAALTATKENIKDNLGIIPETDVIMILDDVIKEIGGSREALMQGLGLKGIADNSEFINLDEDAVISEAELLGGGSAGNEEGEESNDGFNKDVESLINEYWDEIKTIPSIDKLEEFLLVKMEEALTELENKYNEKEEIKTNPSAHSDFVGGGQSSLLGGLGGGLGEMLSSEGTDTPLSKFYKAILYKSSVNEKALFHNGKFDRILAKGVLETQIGILIGEMEKPGSKTFEQYKTKLTPVEPGTPAAEKREADLIEGVPENFRRSSFEDNYHKYIQTCIKNKKPAKSFDEWLVERPKPGGIMGMLDQIKVLFASSGLGKWLKDIFGEDSWITNLFGGEEATEDAEDAAFDKQKDTADGYSNRKAYEIMKDQIKIKELSDPKKWGGVFIAGFTGLTVEALQTKISGLDDSKKVVLGNVLNATDGTILAMARKKDFDLPLLTKLNGITGDIEHKVGESSFTLTNDPSNTPYTITVNGITKAVSDAASLVEETEGLEDYEDKIDDINKISNWSDEAFNGEKKLDNLQPALKGLLSLKADYWKDGFKLTKDNVDKFLKAMARTGSMIYTSNFENREDVFVESDDSFSVKRDGWFNYFGKDKTYTSVKDFFETL